ncbi:MAG: YgaP family membrane protein [Methylobacter sp.]
MNFDFKRMLKFEHNIGEKEKKYRLYGGVALLVISLFIPGGEVLLLLVGLVLVATGYSGWCPAYSGLNKNTCEAAGGDSAEPSSTESDSTDSAES